MFSSFMNPVAIYVGYFSHLAFVVVLPDVNYGNNLQKKRFFSSLFCKLSFSFELVDSSLANSQIHHHRESSSSLAQRLMREFVHLIAV
jgi:hypothetical protein